MLRPEYVDRLDNRRGGKVEGNVGMLKLDYVDKMDNGSGMKEKLMDR